MSEDIDDMFSEENEQVIEAVDYAIKYIANKIGVVLLENKKTKECRAMLPYYHPSEDNEDEYEIKVILKDDKIARYALMNVISALPKVLEQGEQVTLMPYEIGREVALSYKVDIENAERIDVNDDVDYDYGDEDE